MNVIAKEPHSFAKHHKIQAIEDRIQQLKKKSLGIQQEIINLQTKKTVLVQKLKEQKSLQKKIKKEGEKIQEISGHVDQPRLGNNKISRNRASKNSSSSEPNSINQIQKGLCLPVKEISEISKSNNNSALNRSFIASMGSQEEIVDDEYNLTLEEQLKKEIQEDQQENQEVENCSSRKSYGKECREIVSGDSEVIKSQPQQQTEQNINQLIKKKTFEQDQQEEELNVEKQEKEILQNKKKLDEDRKKLQQQNQDKMNQKYKIFCSECEQEKEMRQIETQQQMNDRIMIEIKYIDEKIKEKTAIQEFIAQEIFDCQNELQNCQNQFS